MGDLVGGALLDDDVTGTGDRGITGRFRGHDEERDAVVMSGQREGVRTDLVGDIMVGGYAVGSHQDAVDQARCHGGRGRGVHTQPVRDVGLGEFPCGQAGALKEWSRFAHQDFTDSAGFGEGEDGAQSGSDCGCGKAACIAVRPYAQRFVGAGGGDCVDGVRDHAQVDGDVLVQHVQGFCQDRVGAFGKVVQDPVYGPGEVDGGGAHRDEPFCICPHRSGVGCRSGQMTAS